MRTARDIDRKKVADLLARERARFCEERPRSRAIAGAADAHLLFGVPLHWMRDWPTPFSLFVESARAAEVVDVDGHRYADFCLGDTGAMFGHSPAAVAEAVARQAARGLTAMLPSADAPRVAEELARRFGLPRWQWAMSASDANRFALRWARATTGRDHLLVFNGCYHGTVDEAFVDLVDGVPRARTSLLGQAHDPARFTRVVEFNDLAALDAALADRQVACLMAEPAMTNIGMVLPEPGFWDEAAALCRRHGTLLVLDETHTLSSGPGGYAREHGLAPDMLVLGKPVAGGVPCAVYGMSADLARRAERAKRDKPEGHSGIGTTLSGNALAMAAMRATLESVATPEAYRHMFRLAKRLENGLADAIAEAGFGWCVTRIGARVEFQFVSRAPRNGSEAAAGFDDELEALAHLFLLNRGFMITPFHNMLLVCPDTREEVVDGLIAVFAQWLGALS
ncbi:aspartate aminotransferase family protein [Paludibacterium paludis]|uniref:Aminotransferase n=1 Tax=Paludibacterium paludis TaxID=1225769 RepID=A0A918P599_9NEIS|nr:aspartate aminotransferase family protein [Paludibacterium paludis]GGY24973.1 aminotransferase [Paludibacterium paludis]